MQETETSTTTTTPNGKIPLGLLVDHLELAVLELGYEKQEGLLRLSGVAVGVTFLFSSFIYLQMALIGWLFKMGLGWEGVGLISGSICLVLGMSAILYFGKRRQGVGPPFQGSFFELKRSLSWIEKHFF